MVTNVTGIKSPFNFLLNEIVISYCRSQNVELCHTFKLSMNYLYFYFSLHSPEESTAYT
jgi:hypothetical protein